jgi:putative DNA primase/helicase
VTTPNAPPGENLVEDGQIVALPKANTERRYVVATYAYTDEDGEPLYRVERTGPEKGFRQSRFDGRGGWVYDLEGVRRVPYRARELVRALANGSTIVIVEGEKDADRVAELGLNATTFAGGASGWREDYREWFLDADVVVVPDNDPPGVKYAVTIARSLADLARSVRILELPNLRPKGDVSDWLDAGGTGVELERLFAEAPVWPTVDSLPSTATNGNGTGGGLGRFPNFARSGAIETVDLAGDHLNSARFLAQHQGEVICSPEQSLWFVWSGGWWQEDRLDLVHKRANATIDGLRTWAAEAPTADEFKQRAKHYTDSTRSGRRDGMLSIAGPEVAVAVDQLDRHPHLLACRNGTVNLRSGELGPADPAHLITRGVDLDYDPSAHSLEWERFLARILAEDTDLIAYVKRLLGYAITGEVGEHLLPNFYGDGENGKSQLLIAVQNILGELAAVAPEGLLVESKHEQHPERLAMLRGRRLVVSSELEKRATLAEGLVKTITGGDRISARHMYGRRFDFQPSHTLVILTNHLPRVQGTDRAIWRRLRVVPFEVQISPAERIPDYGRRLAKQYGPAILTWLVEGAVAFYREGVGTCAAVERATARYRDREDVFAQWLAEHTVEVRGRTPVKELRAVWRTWAQDAGVAIGRDQDFVEWLTAHAIEVDRGRTSFARGIGLLKNPNPSREDAPLSTPYPKVSSTRAHGESYGRGVLRGADVQVIKQNELDFDCTSQENPPDDLDGLDDAYLATFPEYDENEVSR